MKNSAVIDPLIAELLKILIYANYMTCDYTMRTQSDVKSQKIEYLSRLQAPSIQRVNPKFSSFKKCYLLFLSSQWVWANMQHRHKKGR